MELRKTILFVDDMFKEERHRHTWEYFFEKEGYTLVGLSSACKAIEEIDNGLLYHLGITDLRLGDMDGYEVINYSKKKHPEIDWFIFSVFPFPYPLAVRGIEKPQRPSYVVGLVDTYLKKGAETS